MKSGQLYFQQSGSHLQVLRMEPSKACCPHIRSGWNPDEKLDDIVSEIQSRISEMLIDWEKGAIFLPHMGILNHAVERFRAQDFISCTALLFPRIEGIIRTHCISIKDTNSLSQAKLVESAVAAKIDKERSLLLPRRFASYLDEVYFAHFDPSKIEVPVSRNSVGHGVG